MIDNASLLGISVLTSKDHKGKTFFMQYFQEAIHNSTTFVSLFFDEKEQKYMIF